MPNQVAGCKSISTQTWLPPGDARLRMDWATCAAGGWLGLGCIVEPAQVGSGRSSEAFQVWAGVNQPHQLAKPQVAIVAPAAAAAAAEGGLAEGPSAVLVQGPHSCKLACMPSPSTSAKHDCFCPTVAN